MAIVSFLLRYYECMKEMKKNIIYCGFIIIRLIPIFMNFVVKLM